MLVASVSLGLQRGVKRQARSPLTTRPAFGCGFICDDGSIEWCMPKRTRHAVSERYCHGVFGPTYREPHLTGATVDRLRCIFGELGADKDLELIEDEIMPAHI